MRLRARFVLWGVLHGLVATSCGNDHRHPPFVSGACTVPPCSTPTSRGSGAADAGRPADAASDSESD